MAARGKLPLLWIVLVGGGCALGAVAVRTYLKKHAASAQMTLFGQTGTVTPGQATPDTTPVQPTEDGTPPSSETAQRPDGIDGKPVPETDEKANVVSTLGAAGTVDVLDVPFELPKGMLDFLRGIDLLSANKPTDAIPFFTHAVEADQENSDFFTARGSCYVIAERMKDGLPDLERALKLNPKNAVAGRMARLACLMIGDQQQASKYAGHGWTGGLDFLVEEVGNGYGSAERARQQKFRQDPRDAQRTSAAIEKLPRIAEMVASSYRSGEENAVHGVFAVGVAQFNAKDYAGARKSFADVIAKYPYDWTSRYYHARSLLETGDPEPARRELTYVLVWKRFLPEAFIARALCAVKQNDLKRADADLKIAMKLAPGKAAEAQAAVAELSKKNKEGSQDNDVILWDALGAAAKNNGNFDDLVDAALVLQRSVNARRIRCDEQYQDKLYELCTAVREHPNDANLIADLVQFLRDNHDVLTLQVGPYATPQPLRWQTQETRGMEQTLAFQLVNEGIRADANNARCWALNAAILLHVYNRCEEAEGSGQRALQLNPKLIAAHMVLSDCYKQYTFRWREKASALRRPKTATKTIQVYDQHGNFIRNDYEEISIPPPAEDLARAAECDRQAELNLQREQTCLNNALTCAKGTPQEPFYQALMFFLKGDNQNARPWLEKAVTANPNDPRMRQALANCLRGLGLEEEYIAEFWRVINLQETTAELPLNVAWTKIEQNKWDSARKILLQARELDPSDARIYAWMGVLNEYGDKDLSLAQGSFRAALAQEEASARANGTSYSDRNATSSVSAEALGLSMLLRLRLAKLCFQSNPDAAINYYLMTVANEPRIGDWGLAKSVGTAIMPNPERSEKSPNFAMPLVSILKNNRIYCAQALMNKGRNVEAVAQFAAAENFENRLPQGGTAYLEFELEPQFVPFRVSSMAIYVKCMTAQSLIQEGKKDLARVELEKVRYYLANRLSAQRAMTDDPIPGIYDRLAPLVGLRPNGGH
jgi:Tfp pilus assembly protein PilF